jgi:hypothetical protein
MAQSSKNEKLKLAPLVAAIYFCVSGGPHGLEPLMQSGAGMGLLLILVTPLVWAIPTAFMTAELASAIPAEGGYYVWIKRALGDRWAAWAAWWMWLYSWVDVAIYPVLFASYVSALLSQLGWAQGFADNPLHKWLIGLVIIIPMTWLNLRGAKTVGKTSLILGGVLLLPFVVMVALGLPKVLANPAAVTQPFVPTGNTTQSALGAGLFVVMWNYLGWDSLSTVSAEVDRPWKNFPKAIFIALPLIVLSYLLPTLVGLAVVPELDRWEEGLWPEIGEAIGGKGLGIWIAITGMASAAGLFAATMLGATRIPLVLARDHLLPEVLTRTHPKFGTPVNAILVSACAYTLFSYSSFENLAVVDVVLYSSAILVELAALIVLRRKEPSLERPYRIPGGYPVLALFFLMPAGIIAFAVYSHIQEEGRHVIWWSLAALALAPIFTFAAMRKRA